MTVSIYNKSKFNNGYFRVANVTDIEMDDKVYFILKLSNGSTDIYRKDEYEISKIHG